MVSFQGRGKSTRLLREAGGIRDGRRGTFTFFFTIIPVITCSIIIISICISISITIFTML